MNVHFSSKTDLHATPQDFFDRLNALWAFDLDVCATPENAKCARYFTKEQDGLAQEWGGADMDEPSLWPRDRALDAQGLRIQPSRGDCYLPRARPYRYRVVARLRHAWQHLLYPGAVEVRRRVELRAVSECRRYFPASRLTTSTTQSKLSEP